MALTERQCWKVVRQLVVEKNNEYRDFLSEMFGIDGYKEILGHTRKMFLEKFGIKTWENFEARAMDKNGGKKPNSQWLENLSVNDLLLFLDFRCRILQDIYDLGKKNNTISKRDVKIIIDSTNLSTLANYNSVELQCGSKPARVEGEKKNSELEYSSAELKEMALQQVLGGMAEAYIKNLKIDVKSAVNVVNGIKTFNVTPKGEQTGYKLREPVEVAQSEQKTAKKMTYEEEYHAKLAEKNPIKAIGFSADPSEGPICVKVVDGKKVFVNTFNELRPNAVIVQTLGGTKILPFTQDDYVNDPSIIEMLEHCAIEEKFRKEPPTHKQKQVGLNIQGTPVYEDENGDRYTSTGERVAEDEFIDNSEDNWGL